MKKSRLKNKYPKWPSQENCLAFEKIKNKCNNLLRKTKNVYFEKLSKNGNFATSKIFWNIVKPFVSNKCAISDEIITITADEN